MAVYFLQHSQRYREETRKDTYRRREVICQMLKDDYKVRRAKDTEVFDQAAAILAGEQITLTPSTYHSDKVCIRGAYLWLTARNEEEKAAVLKTCSSSAQNAIKHLRGDGIECWADLKFEETSAAPLGAPVSNLAPPAPLRPRLKLSDCRVGTEVVETFSQLVENLELMLDENQRLREEILRITEESDPLKARASDDQQFIELMESELVAAEQKVRELREIIRSSQANARAATLETIALENPDFPQLLVIAQQLKERQSKQDRIPELLHKLPTTYNWQSDAGKIEYRNQFLRALENLTSQGQGQVIKQLETLAEHNSEHASLHTRKTKMRLPYSPAGCLVSRGADDLRFTWKKNGDITVY